MRAERLKGHLDGLLLGVVASGGPLHGYAIIEELRRLSGGAFSLPEGTVYPALHRLEKQRLLTSRWSTDTPRRRRVYELTDRGGQALCLERQAWSTFSGAMEAVLGGASWPTTV
ncbi:MAG: helix-turn-helix transcriptional regulator [Actinomycetota bacterium]|nr:helix-turn-helix transcriptional regulator [Actinomycetota bacterium]